MRERRHRLRHLSGRFITSLSARAPTPDEVASVRAALNAGEWACWARLGRADRVEAIATSARLPAEIAADSRWVAAALVHDVGKAECGLGTVGRSVATVRGWVQRPEQIGGRAGAYLRHAEIGAAQLRAAGARPEPVAWAATHHDAERWPLDLIPESVCVARPRPTGKPCRTE